MKWAVNLFSIFFMMAAHSLLAGEEQIRFEHLNTEMGLSQSWVTAILEDRFGFMWFGTKDGLNRYDGYEFHYYTYEEKNPNSLSNVTINHLFEGVEGDLWICTSNGLNILRRETDRVERIKLVPNLDILTALQDSRGRTWVGTAEGLYYLDLRNDSIRLFEHSANDYRSISSNMVFCLYEDSRGNIWVGTDGGLNRFDPEKSEFTKLPLAGTSLPGLSSDLIYAITEDDEGRLWIGSSRGGLDVIRLNHSTDSGLLFEHVHSGSVMALSIDRNNNLWIGKHETQGLAILDLKAFHAGKTSIREIKQQPYDPHGLSDNSIYTIYTDTRGDVWIGTYGKGINFFSNRVKKFHTRMYASGDPNTISANAVNCFLEEEKYLWIGTESGLNRIDKKTGNVKIFYSDDKQQGSIGSDAIYKIYLDSRNDLWIGTWAGGLNLYDRRTEQFKRYLHDPADINSIRSNNVFDIIEGPEGNLWIATIGGGLNIMDRKAQRFTYYLQDFDDPNSLHDNYVNSLCLDAFGDLWVSTYNTLNQLNLQTRKFTWYHRQFYQEGAMQNADLEMIFEDSKRNLWLCTEAGLVAYDRRNNQFRSYTTTNGLPSRNIKAIMEDRHGNLWISTNNGISKFVSGVSLPTLPRFVNYNIKDGISGNEFIKRSVYLNEEGLVYFGSNNGYTYFYPDSITASTYMPLLRITDLLLYNRRIYPGSKDKILEKDILVTHSIRVNHKQAVLGIHFAALEYLNPSKIDYRYKLEGFEEEWNEVGRQRMATYTNLNPGKYRFLVECTNSDGIWREQPEVLLIHVLTPWYKSKVFLISLIVSVFALAYLLYQIRLANLRRQTRYLEAKVTERTERLTQANKLLQEHQTELEVHRNNLESLVENRTRELEIARKRAEASDQLKSAFLANMSHEIRTPMNAIMGFANLLKDNALHEDDKKRFIDIITHNSESLLVFMNDILEISLIQVGQVKLDPVHFKPADIISEVCHYFSLKLTDKITINCLPGKPEDIVIKNDPVRFRQIITNLVGNAVKFTDEGYIHAGFKIMKDHVQFFVKDTGIGIPREELSSVFEYFRKIESPRQKIYRGAGLGLAISRELVEMMGGKIWLESTPGKGSTFYFTLPL